MNKKVETPTIDYLLNKKYLQITRSFSGSSNNHRTAMQGYIKALGAGEEEGYQGITDKPGTIDF